MSEKPVTVFVPLGVDPTCECARCAILRTMHEHADGEDGNALIGALVRIVAEIMMGIPEDGNVLGDEIRRLFLENLNNLRSGNPEGESVH